MAITIRAARESDAQAIQAIYAPFVTDTVISFEEAPPSVEEMASRIRQTAEAYPYLVAELDGEVVGYAYATAVRARAAYRHSAEVTVYVSNEAHRKGVGRALYTQLIEDLAGRGFHALFACITVPNEASVALHEAVGFEPAGVWKGAGRKFERWIDVGWWQMTLLRRNGP